MKMIVAVDNNWAIGNNGDLLAYLPTDLKNFKKITEGKTVVMGRKTFESLPNKPLKDRINIVLTTDPNFKYEGVTSMTANIPAMVQYFDYLKTINREVYIIGGQQIYEQFLPYTSSIYVTKIDHEFEAVDTFFPNLDRDLSWYCNYGGNNINENGFTFRYLEYKRAGGSH